MKTKSRLFRWICLIIFTLVPTTSFAADPIPSWNKGSAKDAIVSFVIYSFEIGSRK